MFPIRDSNIRRRFPIVNYLIIIINIAVFIIQVSQPVPESFIYQNALIPTDFRWDSIFSYQRIFFSMFMHGGWFHILSNMWMLHVFGDNVEDNLGHFSYLSFYLMAGLAAALFQLIFSTGSVIPVIGASGAIAGVLGAYIVLFRHSRIRTLVFFFFFLDLVDLPAWFFIGYWFIIQIFSGIGTLVTFDVNQGGIAYYAHIGGFIFGYITAGWLK